MICFYFLEKREVHFAIAKFLLIAVSVLGIFITQTIIKGSMSREIIIAYAVTAIITGLVLNINIKTKNQDISLRHELDN